MSQMRLREQATNLRSATIEGKHLLEILRNSRHLG
jgi:hypothetical protein